MSVGRAARSDGPLRNLPAYLQIIRGRLRVALAYRQNAFFMLAVVIVQIFVLRKVWTALYGGADVVKGVALADVLVYLTIANLQNWAMQDSAVGSHLYSLVREGRIAFDILRPAGFVQQMLAHLVGGTLSMVLFATAALPLVALVGTLGPPASLTAFGYWLPSLLVAFGISMLLNLIVGLGAFWTTEFGAFGMLYTLVSQFLAGVLVPLYFFPDWLRTVAEVLPFQAMTFTPVAIYGGQLSGGEAIRAIGVQLFWAALLAGAVRLIWSRALHRVVVQGG
ncbi:MULTISPECIES: ABC transporter permease [unclassified Streptomyces]|uniref:ABC transporter permease n=1 Tax=unclassified Streptomyces TaxID=2593676 RepID=UPI0037FFB912